MKRIIILFLMFLFFLNVNSMSRISSATRVMAFIISHEYLINLAIDQNPQYSTKIRNAKQQFDNVYGNVLTNIEEYFIDNGQEKAYLKIKQNCIDMITEEYKNSLFKEENCDSLISTLNSEANFKIDNVEMLSSLAFFQFNGEPLKEFRNGYTYIYSPKGHPKAKGTDWQFKLPISWIKEEGERPNMIQKFRSVVDEKIVISCIISVRDNSNESSLSQKELDELFSNRGLKNLVNDDKILNFYKINLDGCPGIYIEGNSVGKRLQYDMSVMNAYYIFYFNKQLYYLTFGVGAADLNTDITTAFKNNKNLFDLIANSIVVNSKWNQKKS